MARAQKLKVFRMPVGFHDAYVAAPSRKAAIEAWGADKDVFRRGLAEVVDDPKLMEEPLGRPGEIVKRLRGTAAEQIAALGPSPQSGVARGKTEAPKARKSVEGDPPAKTKPPPKPKPKPSRKNVEEAEQALADAEARHEEQMAAIRKREAALAAERQTLETKQRQERDRLEARREKARAAYEAAMAKWRG